MAGREIPLQPPSARGEPDQTVNYFNYFTEIEEHFQRARGRQIYLCPLDWALIESWKEAGIPLEAALAGIDDSFAAFASGRRKDASRPRSLAYCAAAVVKAAEAAKEAGLGAHPAPAAQQTPGLEHAKIATFLRKASTQLAAAELPPLARPVASEVAADLDRMTATLEGSLAPQPDSSGSAAGIAGAAEPRLLETPPMEHCAEGVFKLPTLEALDRWLTALDDRLFAELQAAAPADVLAAVREEYERELAPYRRKLKTEQWAMVERQFLHKRLLERFRVPRLSLFYML